MILESLLHILTGRGARCWPGWGGSGVCGGSGECGGYGRLRFMVMVVVVVVDDGLGLELWLWRVEAEVRIGRHEMELIVTTVV